MNTTAIAALKEAADATGGTVSELSAVATENALQSGGTYNGRFFSDLFYEVWFATVRYTMSEPKWADAATWFEARNV